MLVLGAYSNHKINIIEIQEDEIKPQILKSYKNLGNFLIF